MKINSFFLFVIILIFGNITVVFANDNEVAQSELQPITLQLQWKHQFQFAGYYAAIAKGYYQEVGLNVNILEISETIKPVDNVIKENAQFGVSTSDLLLSRAQGKPVVALATIYQHSPFIFLTLKSSGIDNIHQLMGKKVMIEPHASELFAYFEQEQIPVTKMIQIPHTFDPNALIKEEIDGMSAYSTDEPFLLEKEGIEYQIFKPRAGGIDFYGDTLYTTENYLKEHPEQVETFVNASLKGWEYALKNKEEIIELILTEYSQRHSREHLQFEARKTQELILPEVVEIGYINKGRWEYIRDTYAELGMIPKDYSLKGFIYSDYSLEILKNNSRIFWLSIFLGSSVFILLIVGIVATRFYQLNQLILQEIKERIAVEKELKILEKRYRILAENAPFPVIISLIPEGNICYSNPKASQQLEISQDDLLKCFTKDFYVNLEDREKTIDILQSQGFLENYQLQFKTAKGKIFWANLAVTMIEFDEKPAAFIALIDITEQKLLEQKLQLIAMTDELTGVYNRRYFMIKGTEELYRAKRYKLPFSLLMFDADYFKNINDNYGHDMGDKVLKHLTFLLEENLRNIDILGRLGGEEFGILLPNTEPDQAMILAQRLRQIIEENSLTVKEQLIPLTVSIGLSSFTPDIINLDDLLKRADIALYQAKENGRNCVVKFS